MDKNDLILMLHDLCELVEKTGSMDAEAACRAIIEALEIVYAERADMRGEQ